MGAFPASNNDTHNVMIFGGCKNFLGNSKSCGRNFILFPGLASRASGNRRCQTDDNGVFANQFFHENTCFVADGLFYTFEKCTNANLATTVYETAHKALFTAATRNVQVSSWPSWVTKVKSHSPSFGIRPLFAAT